MTLRGFDDLKPWQIHLEKEIPFFDGGRKLCFWRQIPDYEKSRIEVLRLPELKEIGVGSEMPHDAGVIVSRDGLQNLMDALWGAGLRPKDIGTAGHLAATQAHLAAVSQTHDRLLTMIEKRWAESPLIVTT